MRISDLLKRGTPTLSFEVFPPKRDGDVDALYRCFDELAPLKPDYISVTYGAGGSNAGLHFEINQRLLKLGITPLAHFTCVGQGREAIAGQLKRLEDAGVENVLALRGDPPKGEAKFTRPADGFGYATELIEFIRAKFKFCIGGACYPDVHPEAESAGSDLGYALKKQDLGADFLVTQMFFDNQSYFRFVKQARERGLRLPVVPGIMPVLTHKFFARDWGARIPPGFKEGYSGADPEGEERSGIAYAVQQCQELLHEKAPGLHLYTMNKSKAAVQIVEALRS